MLSFEVPILFPAKLASHFPLPSEFFVLECNTRACDLNEIYRLVKINESIMQTHKEY